MSEPTTIAMLLSIVLGLIGYAVLVPRSNTNFKVGGDRENDEERGRFMSFLGVVSSEIYNTLPENAALRLEKSPSRETEKLLQRSGNPWNLKANEFTLMKIALAVIGMMAGALVWFLLKDIFSIPIYALLAICGLFGFMVPKFKHSDAAKQRDLDFKRQLPDALDLLIISLSAGVPFATALRNALPNMKEGVLKDEFYEISKMLDSGKTLSESLDSFAKKAPNESIEVFIRAVQEATELNVPLIEVLESRADASRKEFFALVQQKTATLESKMFMVLTPTLIPALLILVVAPAASSLMGSM